MTGFRGGLYTQRARGAHANRFTRLGRSATPAIRGQFGSAYAQDRQGKSRRAAVHRWSVDGGSRGMAGRLSRQLARDSGRDQSGAGSEARCGAPRGRGESPAGPPAAGSVELARPFLAVRISKIRPMIRPSHTKPCCGLFCVGAPPISKKPGFPSFWFSSLARRSRFKPNRRSRFKPNRKPFTLRFATPERGLWRDMARVRA